MILVGVMDRFGFGGIGMQVPPNVLSAAAFSDYTQKIQAHETPCTKDTAGPRQGIFPEADLPLSCH